MGGKFGTVDLNNSIILGNQSSTGNSQIAHRNAGSTTIVTSGAKIVGENASDFDVSGFANVDNAAAINVFDTTLDNTGVIAGALGDKGRPVQTIALLAGGAAVDVGDQSLLVEATVGSDH